MIVRPVKQTVTDRQRTLLFDEHSACGVNWLNRIEYSYGLQ